MLLMGVPGPCTSFSRVSAPVADAAADAVEASRPGSDAEASTPGSEGGCDAGIPLSWAEGDSALCQNHANAACCPLLSKCSLGEPSGCPAGIQCINECPAPRSTAPGSCAAACFETYTGLESTLTKFRTAFFGPDGGAYPDTGVNQCRWVELAPLGDK
jgi:hypothetical protein